MSSHHRRPARALAIAPLLVALASAEPNATCTDPLDDATLAAAAASFRKNGYAVVRSFATADEVESMRASMREMVDAWWKEERLSSKTWDKTWDARSATHTSRP